MQRGKELHSRKYSTVLYTQLQPKMMMTEGVRSKVREKDILHEMPEIDGEISDITETSESKVDIKVDNPSCIATEALATLKEAIRIMRNLEATMNGGTSGVSVVTESERRKLLLVNNVTEELTKRANFT